MVSDYEQLAALASYRAAGAPLPMRDNAGQHLLDAKPGNAENVTRKAWHTTGGTPQVISITDNDDG